MYSSTLSGSPVAIVLAHESVKNRRPAIDFPARDVPGPRRLPGHPRSGAALVTALRVAARARAGATTDRSRRGRGVTVAAGGAFVGDNVVHTHDRTCAQPTDCRDSFWEIRLARPTALPASGDLETQRVFVSSTLESPLEGPVPVRFEMLRLEPGAVASLPATAGQYLYVRGGRIVYQGASGPEQLRAGEGRLTPGQSVVIARNDGREPAALLTWRATR